MNLTPPGAEPHDLELSARDVERVREADLVLYLGRASCPPSRTRSRAREAIDLLAGLLGAASTTPHILARPAGSPAVARESLSALGDSDGAADVVAELERLDAEYRAGLAALRAP